MVKGMLSGKKIVDGSPNKPPRDVLLDTQLIDNNLRWNVVVLNYVSVYVFSLD